MKHKLKAIISGAEEIFLMDSDDLYILIEAAEKDYRQYDTFRICGNGHCLVGVRFYKEIGEVFWRTPRVEKVRGRDSKIMKFLDEKILSHLRKP